MDKLLHKFMLGSATAALLAAVSATSALAQAANNSADQSANNSANVEQVEVSASRISIAGYTQPTPVTVVDSAQLDRDAQPSLADSLRELPSVGASFAPNIGGGGIGGAAAGTSTINLRNLGTLRTLVLFDGQRVMSSDIVGGNVDISVIPTSIIQRVDVVTGGASASWGSDAVAGVVNIVINKNFTGFKANIEGDDSTYNNPGHKEEASWGEDFDGDRGHFIISASHLDDPVPVFSSQTAPYDTQLVNNPAYAAGNGQPNLIHEYIPNLANQTPGGLINGGPLAGIQFTGTGTPAPFNQGTKFTNPAGGLTINSVGGTPNPESLEAYPALTANPYHSSNLFMFGRYKLTDSIQASVQLNYSSNRVQVVSGSIESSYAAYTIHNDNAYLPASIAALMAANNVTTVPFGTTLTGNLPLSQLNNIPNLGALSQTFLPLSQNNRQMLRGVFTLDGELGNDWSWNAYYQHGTVLVRQQVFNDPVKTYLTNAIDAVSVTAANRGTSGLPIGNIVCRSTLTNPTNGCQPLDVFGTDNTSLGALQYINDGNSDINHELLSEDVVSASAQGVLPWGLPAGRVAVAFGTDYRKEAGHLIASPLSQASAYTNGNASDFSGEYNVEEGFLEVNTPLLKNDVVQSADFVAAGRMTSYSTSGLVETWKLGLNSQVNDDIRLRTTWSLDIRAPNLNELFSAASGGNQGLVDPHTGLTVPLVAEVTSGNRNLKPEVSTTVSGGVVLTPHWIPGLSASFDWYSINIKGAIYTLSPLLEDQECAAGQALYCGFLQFNGPGGALSQVNSQPANAASETDSGLDFQLDYPMELFNGTLLWHLVGNYTDEETETTANSGAVDFANSLGANSTFQGVPKFRGTLSATYAQGPWSATVQGRFLGAAVLNNAWNFNNFVDNNNVPAIAYLDVRASYQWTDHIQLYGAVDNLNDVSPPLIAAEDTTPFQVFTRPELYDTLGRQFRIGVRVSY
jgi:outer membrane cobalamin receptor